MTFEEFENSLIKISKGKFHLKGKPHIVVSEICANPFCPKEVTGKSVGWYLRFRDHEFGNLWNSQWQEDVVDRLEDDMFEVINKFRNKEFVGS